MQNANAPRGKRATLCGPETAQGSAHGLSDGFRAISAYARTTYSADVCWRTGGKRSDPSNKSCHLQYLYFRRSSNTPDDLRRLCSWVTPIVRHKRRHTRSDQVCQVLPQLGQAVGLLPPSSASSPTGKKHMETTIAHVGKPPCEVSVLHLGQVTCAIHSSP